MDTDISKKEQGSLLSAALFIVLCAGLTYIILFFPLSRQIGLTFRNTLYVFPLVFIIAFAYAKITNRYIKLILVCILFAFVLLPYSGLLNSGLSDQYALGGIVPWSDAFTMQLNTQRFLYGGQMGQSTAIRPISTVFYAVFLHIFNNNYFALQVFLCISTAICLIYALNEVIRCYGTVCGAIFFTILYYYIRQRLGTYMTEPYGFICGLLACRWLLKGIHEKKQLPILIGFLLLSIGLNARPAAMFLFPALGLWYFFVFLRANSRRFLYGSFALLIMLSGFLVNHYTQTAVYGSANIPNRQAAEMVYGLCLGGQSWGDVVGTKEMISLNDSDNVIRDVAELCKPILKEHPENILSALRTIFIDSLVKSEYYGAFSYVNGNPKAFQPVLRYSMMCLWLAGVILLIRKRKEQRYSFLLCGVVGIILSECAAVPFSTNYLRLYAVSMWIPACVTGIMPQYLYERISKKTDSKLPEADLFIPSRVMNIYEIIFISITILGAFFVKDHPLQRPVSQITQCEEAEDLLITSIDYGSFIYLAEQPDLQTEHYPYFRLPYVRQHFHDTASVEMFPFTDAIDKPTAIIRGIDLQNLSDSLIFAPLDMVEGKYGYAQFCGNFIEPPILRNDRFFIPTSVYFYEDSL